MRPSVIRDGLNSLQADEEVTAKQIVQWIVGAIDIAADIPDFAINSDGRVSISLFKHLRSTASDDCCYFKDSDSEAKLHQMMEAVAYVFEKTIERGHSLKCWLQIGRFLNDLVNWSTFGLYTLVSFKISATILRKMTAVPNFDESNDIVDSMLRYWKCGFAFAAEVKNETKTCKHLFPQMVRCFNEFFDLIGKNLIFFSDAFYLHTAEILYIGLINSDRTILQKSLDAILFALGSTDEESKKNMAKFLNGSNFKESLITLTISHKCSSTRNMLIKVLKTMLEYSRDTNVPFDIDWPEFFAHALYSYDDIVDLIICEAYGTEQDERSKSYNLIERVVQIHIRHNDKIGQLLEKTSISNLLNKFKSHVNFVTCEDLFYVLRKNVSDNPDMCKVLILLIDYSAKALAEHTQNRELYIDLIKNVYRQINVVKPYPELLCRLINIFDLPVTLHDNVFREKVKSVVPEAFFRSKTYGTAIELLEILKVIGFNASESMALFERIMNEEITGNQPKEMVILLLALNDVFDIFKVLNAIDRRTVFDYFKKRFETNVDDGAKTLYITLIVHIVAAYHWLPQRFPGEAWDTTENEALLVHRHLNEMILAKEWDSIYIIYLGIAVCVYYTNFTLPLAGQDLCDALVNLARHSIVFRLNYKLDAKESAGKNDLQLLIKYWRNAIAIYDSGAPANELPTAIFECYTRLEINFINQADEFISTIVQYGAEDRYNPLVRTIAHVCKCVTNVTTLLKKLFASIKTSNPSSDLSMIATMIFLKLLDSLCNHCDRPRTIWNIQKYLYKNEMKCSDHRKMAMRRLIALIDNNHKGLEEFRQFLRKNVIAGVTASDLEPNEDEMDVDEQPHEETSDSESQNPRHRSDQPGRGSLIPIDQSILL